MLQVIQSPGSGLLEVTLVPSTLPLSTNRHSTTTKPLLAMPSNGNGTAEGWSSPTTATPSGNSRRALTHPRTISFVREVQVQTLFCAQFSVCLSDCLFACSLFCLSVCLSFSLCVCVCVCVCLCVSVFVSVCVSVCVCLRKRWEDNIREWTGLEFAQSQRAVENREKWRKLVAKSSVVPQRHSR